MNPIRRNVVLTAVLAATLSTPAGSQTSRPAFWVCVTNERSNDLTLIDGNTRRVAATIPLGKRPRGVHASPDGRWLYVALSGSPIEGPPDARNASTASAPPDRSADGIGVVDLRTRRLVRMIPVGHDPEEFAVTRDGTVIAVSNEDASTATLVRTSDGRLLATTRVGSEPEGVTLGPGGRSFYVTSESSGTIDVIDARTGGALHRFGVPGRPRSIAFTPDGRLAFVPSETTAEVHVVENPGGRMRRSIRLPAGSRPMKALVSPDGETVYVSNGRGGTVSEIDVETLRVRRTYAAGTRPWGLGLSPDGRWLFAADGPGNAVAWIDTQVGREVQRIPAGTGPWGIAVVMP